MGKRDYYEILGISRDADVREIKQAYRRLALKLHPDRNPNDREAEEKFKEAAEAYDVLSNPEKREIYDRFGHEGLHGQTGFSGVDDIFTSFGDIFSEFFGGDIFGGRRRSRPPKPARGADLRYDLTLTLRESLKGTKKEVNLRQLRKCEKCEGTGAAPGTTPEVCTTCRGQGQVVQRTGFMTLATTCPACDGRGTWIPSPCNKCEGTGRAYFSRTVNTVVPPGVDTGMRLRLAGEGEHPETGGEPGDLYIFITVEPDDFFTREGDDLHYELTIPYTRAILGDEHVIDVFGDQVLIRVPQGAQPNDEIRIKGKGAPRVGRDTVGDLVIKIRVTLPDNPSTEELKLISKLDKLIGITHKKAGHG